MVVPAPAEGLEVVYLEGAVTWRCVVSSTPKTRPTLSGEEFQHSRRVVSLGEPASVAPTPCVGVKAHG